MDVWLKIDALNVNGFEVSASIICGMKVVDENRIR